MREIKPFRIAQIVYFLSLVISYSIVIPNKIILPEFWEMALIIYTIPAATMLFLAIGTGAFILFCLVGTAIISVITGKNKFE